MEAVVEILLGPESRNSLNHCILVGCHPGRRPRELLVHYPSLGLSRTPRLTHEPEVPGEDRFGLEWPRLLLLS